MVDGAHQPDVIAIGIGDDRIPGAPEGVERWLAARIAGRGQFGVPLVDGLPGGSENLITTFKPARSASQAACQSRAGSAAPSSKLKPPGILS